MPDILLSITEEESWKPHLLILLHRMIQSEDRDVLSSAQMYRGSNSLGFVRHKTYNNIGQEIKAKQKSLVGILVLKLSL